MRMRAFATVLALSTALTLATTPAASAHDRDWPQGKLTLTISFPEESPRIRHRATLTCNPDGGNHPQAEAACDQLRYARGHIDRIPSDDGPCTMGYRPTRVRAWGYWRGWFRLFSDRYTNPCVANRLTGGILFSFYSAEEDESATGVAAAVEENRPGR